MFYAIALIEHGHWEDVQLIETIKRNWPNNTHISNNMILARQYSHEETFSLRKSQINAPTTLSDGSYYMGFGETVAGTSSLATFRALPIRKMFGRVEPDLRKNFFAHFPEIVANEGDVVNAELIVGSDGYFAVRLADHGSELDLGIGSIKEIVERLKG